MLLGRNVVEGGSIVIRVIFKDEAGQYYVPVEDSVAYTLYAQHIGDSTWEIVEGKKDVVVPSASVIDILLQGDALAMMGNCSTKRRVIIDWTYLRNSEETFGRDMVDFQVEPLPVLA